MSSCITILTNKFSKEFVIKAVIQNLYDKFDAFLKKDALHLTNRQVCVKVNTLNQKHLS